MDVFRKNHIIPRSGGVESIRSSREMGRRGERATTRDAPLWSRSTRRGTCAGSGPRWTASRTSGTGRSCRSRGTSARAKEEMMGGGSGGNQKSARRRRRPRAPSSARAKRGFANLVPAEHVRDLRIVQSGRHGDRSGGVAWTASREVTRPRRYDPLLDVRESEARRECQAGESLHQSVHRTPRVERTRRLSRAPRRVDGDERTLSRGGPGARISLGRGITGGQGAGDPSLGSIARGGDGSFCSAPRRASCGRVFEN